MVFPFLMKSYAPGMARSARDNPEWTDTPETQNIVVRSLSQRVLPSLLMRALFATG